MKAARHHRKVAEQIGHAYSAETLETRTRAAEGWGVRVVPKNGSVVRTKLQICQLQGTQMNERTDVSTYL